MVFLALFASMSFAGQVNVPKSTAEIKRDFVVELNKAGVVADTQVSKALEQIKPGDKDEIVMTRQEFDKELFKANQNAKGDGIWERYVSWINFMKVIAVALLLYAFYGTLMNIAKSVWHLIVAVPMEVYQASFAAVTLLGLFAPHMLYASEPFYVALFSAFAFPMVLGWIVATHDWLATFIENFFKLGVPPGCVIGFWTMVYFGALALFYQSAIFGFFAVVGMSAIVSFGMTYRPGVLYLDFNENYLYYVLWGHMIVLGTYVYLGATGSLPPQAALFKAGLEYYATIALGLSLLVAASPFYGRGEARAFYSVVMLIAAGLSTYIYHVAGFPVIGSIIMVFFVLWLLEWISRLAFSAGVIVGCLFLGLALFITATVFQSYGQSLVFKLAGT